MSFSRPSTTAGHDGRCPVCDGAINVGDRIVLSDDQEWIHATCEEDA